MGKSASKPKRFKSHNPTWSKLNMPIKGRALPPLPSIPDDAGTPTTGTGPPGTPYPQGSPDKPLHMPIKQWLSALDLLDQYDNVFSKFKGVEELLYHDESNIKNLGVNNWSHRARIVSSLRALKEKYEGRVRKKYSFIRHSMAVDSEKQLRKIQEHEDLRVVTESTQSKSLSNLIMEPMADPSMDQAALRKSLEWELSLDARDLRSHAWYHGAIPRGRAEEIVQQEGDFLVRDCTSQPGDYVLTCRTKYGPLHFVINKVLIQPDTVYERVQYQFEDEPYDTVPDLITYYVGSGKPISAASGARIQHPRNRLYPLSFYASRYSAASPSLPPSLTPSPAPSPSPGPISGMNSRIPPRLPCKKQRSQSLTPAEAQRAFQDKCNSADGVIQAPIMTRSAGTDRFSTHSLPRHSCNARNPLSPGTVGSTATLPIGRTTRTISRVTSDPSLSPCAERRRFIDEGEPPPKPSRVPPANVSIPGGSQEVDSLHHGDLQRVASYHTSGSDSGNGSGDSAQSSAADTADIPTTSNENPPPRPTGVIIKNPRYLSETADCSLPYTHQHPPHINREIDYARAEQQLLRNARAFPPMASAYDLENFSTLLLPSMENKPLEHGALRSIKLTLKETAPRILANHLTRVDVDLILGKTSQELTPTSGIELCGLPHGQRMRLDLIERTECLKLIVAVTILTCTNDSERAETLNKWIEVAIDTKTALGNLYGFCGVMLGLCMPQIQKLNSAWHMLRQKYTDSAFNFEAKLRPTLKSMNECSNPQAPNTTIPHLLPFILLQERTLEDFIGSNTNESHLLTASCLTSWESHAQDFGLSTLLAHMDAARKFSENLPVYRRNAEIVFGDFSRTEDLILDTFRTEFQMKFLWGSRGAHALPYERHLKFEQIITVMAEKYCGDMNDGTPV